MKKQYRSMTQFFERSSTIIYSPFRKKHDKHKNIGNFATHSSREVFTTCSLFESKHNLDDCKSFKEKVLQKKKLYLSKNCVMTDCF